MDVKVCRSCGKTQKSASRMKNIFNNVEIHEAIFNLTSIKLEHSPELPSCVCVACSKRLLEYNQFRNDFFKTQNQLATLKMVKIEPIFDFEQTMEVETNIPENDELNESISVLPLTIKTDEKEHQLVDIKQDNESDYGDDIVDMDVGSESDDWDDMSDEKPSYVPKSLKHREREEYKHACSLPGCDRKFKTEHRLEQHEMAHKQNFLAGCTICDKDFGTQERLQEHTKNFHESRTNYYCDYVECKGIKFSRKDYLLKHMKRVHKKKIKLSQPPKHVTVYKCDEPGCDKKFWREEKLVSHKRTHAGLKAWPCNLCDKAFSKESSLKDHIYNRHETNEPRYSCEHPECNGRKYWDKNALKGHIRDVHGPKELKPQKFFCDICGKTIASSNSFRSHKAIHDNEYLFECHLCGKKYRIKGELTLHLMRHAGEKNYHCDMCDYKGVTSRNLRNHRNRVHFKKHLKETQCTQCEMVFNKRSGFLLHFKTVHLQLKPYKCQYCDQSFAVKGTMRDHEKRHTGEKNYHCEFCGKGFIQRAAIKAHRDRCMIGK